MPTTANKVQFGLDMCYFAPLSVAAGVYTHSTPVAAPGAIEFEAAPEGGIEPFEADNGNFLMIDRSTGYKLKLKMVLLTEAIRAVIMPTLEDTKFVAFEKNGATYPRFAVLGQTKGDQQNIRFAFYDCILAERPTITHKSTKVGEPDTVELNMYAFPRSDNGHVMAATQSDTDATVYSGWFTTVQQYVAAQG